MAYSLETIQKVLNAPQAGGHETMTVRHLCIDSRRLLDPSTTLFFAIRGPRNDGHFYLRELIDAGVKAFVVQYIPPGLDTKDCHFIQVPDSVEALQQLAAWHRQQFDFPVIAITGSNGKTITKEWLYQVLSSRFQIVRNPKSYNSQVGVPLSVWQMESSHNLGIFEAGISKPAEMDHLENILKPGIGLFTNLGDAHSENFNSLEEKGREKLRLFQNTGVLLGRLGNEPLNRLLQEWAVEQPGRTLLTWSDSDPEADLFIHPVIKERSREIEFQWKGQRYTTEIPFTDQASLENAVLCMLAALYLGLSPEDIISAMPGLQAVEMRLQKMDGINNTILINDTYNSDIQSLEISADFLARQEGSRKNTIILTDILQTEKDPETRYRMVNAILRSRNIRRLIGIGEEMETYSGLFDVPEKEFYPDTRNFLSKLNHKTFSNENILLKGARKFGLEQVVKRLEKQTHQTVFEINLTAIEHNFRYLKSLLPRNTKVMGMVKAFSYGSGSFEVARLLQDAGADYLAVAYADEGVSLRQKGISIPVMVMNPDERSFDVMFEYNLEPEIYSFEILQAFIRAAERTGTQGHGIHLEFDTGMHRLGFMTGDASELARLLKSVKWVEVKSIFSHLAGSDESRLDAFTKNQIRIFRETADSISDQLQIKPMRHILNSAGVLHHPEGVMDMVRLGIALHGIDPGDEKNTSLLPAGSLRSYISQIRTIPPGEGISYGLHSVSDHERSIAVVAIGYADGLDRRLGQGNWKVGIGGQMVPTVGQICMDMFMVDVTAIDCHPGDDVEIFGKQIPIESMAKALNTIPYEILTSVSPRVKRVYWYE